jgi:hypothetical protein
MSATARAQGVLRELGFDFATFTMDRFIYAIEQKKNCEIITIPWRMPPAMFGVWISDGDDLREYIFYRNNVSEAHQIHIQLHELSHVLFGHPTLKLNARIIAKVITGEATLPFDETLHRSPRSSSIEIETETLTNLIQEQTIRHLKLGNLVIHGSPSQEKLANFLQKMGLS